MSSVKHCDNCKYLNPSTRAFCEKCRKPMMHAILRSKGAGLIPEGLLWCATRDELVIGSDPDSDIVVVGPQVGASHVRLELVAGNYVISRDRTDAEVKMNGHNLSPGQKHVINNGAVLGVGSEEIEFIYPSVTIDSPVATDKDTFEIKSLCTKAVNPLGRRSLRILAANHQFSSFTEVTPLFECMCRNVLRLTKLDRAYAFRIKQTADNIDVKRLASFYADESARSQKDISITKSIMGRVLNDLGSIFIDDVDGGPAPTQSMIDFKIKTVVCLPLTRKNSEGKKELIGVIYADKFINPTPLPKGMSKVLQNLCNYLSKHLERCIDLEESAQICHSYGNYLNRLADELERLKALSLDDMTDSKAKVEELKELKEGLDSLSAYMKQAVAQ